MYENHSPKIPDYSQYEQEPIHIPGYIQPHGVLIAVKIPELTILQVSENINQLLGINANCLLGKDLQFLIKKEPIKLINESLAKKESTFIQSLTIFTPHTKKRKIS